MTEEKTTYKDCESFAYEVKTKLTLLWRYFNDMTESTCEGTRYDVVSAEIDGSSTLPQKGQKMMVLGRLTKGYYIEKDDLLAIESALYDVLKMAKEINGETM